MSGILITGDPEESRRVVAITLPRQAWDYLETEADFRGANLLVYVSDMLRCALRVQGYEPICERPPENQTRKVCVL